jgi:hypothetical protein
VLKNDLGRYDDDTPIVVFSHSPLYKYYRNWNFWTEDADDVQAILRGFDRVTVIHGHTHQLLTNRIGNIDFHGMLSTAWPWPYAPEGCPKLTVQMSRPDPFDPNDGCGDGKHASERAGLVDQVYNLWNRNPIQCRAATRVERHDRTRRRWQHEDASEEEGRLENETSNSSSGSRRSPRRRRRARRRRTIRLVFSSARQDARPPSTRNAHKTKENGQKFANELMAQWQRAHPAAKLDRDEREKHSIVEPADNKDVDRPDAGADLRPGDRTRRAELAARDARDGRPRLDGVPLGRRARSQIAVSCDMCHPDAANTHPETYPKFQPQLGAWRSSAT